MRVGLMGGSFDPVHYGHLRAAQWALSAFDLGEVRLIPARQSPFKGPSLATEEHRLTMLKLATQDNGSLAVEDCELNREPPSYTVDTLRLLAARAPAAHFTLLLGSDAISGIEAWRDIETVRRMAQIRVLDRPGHPAWRGDDVPHIPFDGLGVSSTSLREAIKRGESIRYLTPESVRHYIEEKGLYK